MFLGPGLSQDYRLELLLGTLGVQSVEVVHLLSQFQDLLL